MLQQSEYPASAALNSCLLAMTVEVQEILLAAGSVN